MTSRPIAAAFFVVFCLLLCGMILHRQIAAHPLPPDRRQQYDPRQQDMGMDFQDWHPASPAVTQQVHEVVQEELAALHRGDGPKALSLQSRDLRQRFSDPNGFLQVIMDRHPELFHYRQVQYGPVWIAPAGRNARTIILVEGENGEKTPGGFLLIREGGRFKIDHLRPQMPPN